MFLKKETEYALRLLEAIDEGCNARPLSLKAFAKESGISFLFLQRIAAKLKDAGLIKARKGKIGGYWLSKPRATINVMNVIEAIEGPHSAASAVPKLNEEIRNFFENKSLNTL